MKVIAVVGLSKNCGKTTFLNWSLGTGAWSLELGDGRREFPSPISHLPSPISQLIGVTTTGRDGEDIDLVTHEKKPKVKLPAGVYFTAFENVFNEKAVWIEGICKLPFRVIGKNLWLYNTLGVVETEIVGPSHLKEQELLIDIFEKYGCDTVLIDGSLDRKSICMSERVEEIVLVVGAAAGSIAEIREQTEMVLMYSSCKACLAEMCLLKNITYKVGENPPYPSLKRREIVETDIKSIYGHENSIIDILKQEPEWVYFPGALTEFSWKRLKKYMLDFKGKIIFNHPLNMRIGLKDLKEIIQTNKVYSRMRFNLSCVAVNAYSPYGEHIDADILREEMRKMFTDKEVIDVTEVC